MIPSRLICTVLEEMRICIKTLNFTYLESLIEEAQVLANRMEAKLEDLNYQEDLREDVRDLVKQKKQLKKEISAAGEKPVTNNW
tara:strand:- start:44 stop:295 length:252 start_codon:yes stop_codon:yes gene_type:complete